MRYVRTKIYECGQEHMEVEMYYAPSSVRRARGPKTGIATDEVKQMKNEKESVKSLVRLLKSNFSSGQDHYVTFTFDELRKQRTFDEVQKVCKKYFQNLMDRCGRRGIVARWIYVVEIGGKGRYHVHAFVGREVPLSQIVRGWARGFVCSRKVPSDAEAVRQIAEYSLKAPQGKHGWHRSRNLLRPTVETDDKLVASGEFSAIAGDGFPEGPVVELMGRLFPDFQVVPGWRGYYCSAMESPYLYVALQRVHRQKRESIKDYSNPYGISADALRRYDPDQADLILRQTAMPRIAFLWFGKGNCTLNGFDGRGGAIRGKRGYRQILR